MPKLLPNSAPRNTEPARRSREKSETALSRAIRQALESAGCWTMRVNSGRIRLSHGGWMWLAPAGTPDVLVLAPVRGWLEIKRPGETLTSDQELMHARLTGAGWNVAVAHSAGEALEIVRGWGRWVK